MQDIAFPPLGRHSRTITLIVAETQTRAAQIHYKTQLTGIPGTLWNMLLILHKQHQAAPAAGCPDPKRLFPALPAPDSYRIYDWALDEHPLQTGVVELPEPGVAFALFGAYVADDVAVRVVLLHAKQQVEGDTAMRGFLNSPESRFRPYRYTPYSVFISYTNEDSEAAEAFREVLLSKGLSVFLAARSLAVGRRWKDEIHEALRRAKVAVLLLTPRSVNSQWVMLEAGAAWALDIPLVPALMGIEKEALPEPIRDFQCRPYNSSEDREQLASEIFRTLTHGSEA